MFNRKNILIILSIILVVLLFGFVVLKKKTQNNSSDKILPSFTKYVRQTMVIRKTPGLAITIVKNGNIIYAKGFGIRNSSKAPVTPHTVFNIASLTKSFTAALLAIQVDAGKYSWNTKILKLYPKFKLYDPIATKKFEVRDLVSHDSGLPEDTGTIANFGYSNDRIIHALRFIKPVAHFRTQFAYQDVFLVLAQKIIEANGKSNYTNYLRKKLFVPLGMQDSHTAEENLNKLSNVSQRYFYYKGRQRVFPTSNPYIYKKWGRGIELASGGIYSSAIDLAKWLIFQMSGNTVNGRQLISKTNMLFLHTPQTKIQKGDAEGSNAVAYCQGWFYDSHSYHPYKMLFHAGNNSGASAFMAYIPKARIGIAILANYYDPQLTRILAMRFFNLYFKKTHKHLEQVKPHTPENDSQTATMPCHLNKTANLAKYTGVYVNNAYGKIYIKNAGKTLELIIGPHKVKWQLFPCKHNVFQAFWDSGIKGLSMIPVDLTKIEFTSNTENSINEMKVDYLNTDGTGIFVKIK